MSSEKRKIAYIDGKPYEIGSNHTSILKFVKSYVGEKSKIISKIETNNAIKNLKKISQFSHALLIDRGDLSRYIPIERIPLAQEQVIKFLNKINKPTYVATNLLETMIEQNLPTRAERVMMYTLL